ncbi:tol-pal system YbgF family protein [Candidatus Neomarinimicrobiota bacterium]
MILGLVACGGPKTAEEAWKIADSEVRSQRYEKAIQSYENLIAKYPDSPLASRSMFQLGAIYMNNTSQYDLSVKSYSRVMENYPDSPDAVKALFMAGFVSATYLGAYDQAEGYYRQFLEKFPNHELVPAAEFELENLGKDVEEIEALKGIVDAEK